MVLYHIMPSKRIKKKLRGLLKHCLTSLPSRIGENSESVALKDFTSKSAVRDISFHVKAMHETYGHKLLPKLTRDHRAYIASKFERTKIKVLTMGPVEQVVQPTKRLKVEKQTPATAAAPVAATVEVEGLAALVKGLSAKVQASVATWCAEQELANVELIAVGELDDFSSPRSASRHRPSVPRSCCASGSPSCAAPPDRSRPVAELVGVFV